ncbi:MAG: DUF2029 domain-containing protein [Acidobacteriales bacterium]|nr:DUF2029 domain-containing protein [Terriglobales bacterium]
MIGIGVNAVVIGPALVWSFQPGAPRNDFVSFYTAPALLDSGNLYDLRRTEEEQAKYGFDRERQHKLAFLRPPFYALLLKPLAWLPYNAAYLTWLVLSAFSLVLTAILWRHLGLAWMAAALCWSPAVAHVFLRGQATAYLVLFFSLAIALLRWDAPFLAGLILSLCGFKWSLFLTVPLFIVGRRLWRCGAGFLAGSTATLLFSYLVSGPNWPTQYWRVMLADSASPRVAEMANLRGLFHGLPYCATLEIIAASLIALLTWRTCRTAGSLDYAAAATLVSGLLISHHAYLYDCVVLVPALAVLARSSHFTWLRKYAIAMLAPFPILLLLFSPWSLIPQIALGCLPVFMAYEATRKG